MLRPYGIVSGAKRSNAGNLLAKLASRCRNVGAMVDGRDLTTAELQARALEILGGDPADRALWDAHAAEIFALMSATREARHQRPADRWPAEKKNAFVLRAFDHARFEAGPVYWPLEIRALWSLRVRIRNEF